MNNFEIGKKGEALAAGLLRKKGYRIIGRNVRSRLGEMDIIAQQQGVICFVEVKTAAFEGGIFPEVQVTPTKQKQLIRLAQSWLKSQGKEAQPLRFDVVSIGLDSKGQVARTRLIQSAFDADGV